MLSVALASLALVHAATPALACSPPFEEPTIEALGPDQVVVVGTIGEKVDGGRIFHVERWFNPVATDAEIIIAFKEGEPVGDCSYPVAEDQHLIIAPYLDDFGKLGADLGTLQANPATDVGRRYMAEAESLYGAGVVPRRAEAVEPEPDVGAIALVALVVIAVAGGMLFAFRR